MTKLYLILFACLPIFLLAQPVNDDCTGLIDLGTAPFCETTIFDNIGATESDIGYDNIPGCWANGSVDNDVWFKITASDTIIDYTITLTGVNGPNGEPSIFGPQVAIYRGICAFDGFALLSCYESDPTDSEIKFNIVGLDLGEMYFIRINGVIAEGAFQLCVEEQEPTTTIDIGGTSTLCEGILYDSGGPDGDYGPNENHIYTICPQFPYNECVTFNLEYYHIEYAEGYYDFPDQLIFYDGPDINSPVIPYNSLDANFLNPEQAGAVCQTIQASSGCITVQFISDGDQEFEGFAGNWICSASACETQDALVISQGASEQQIADNLTSSGTFVTVDTIICDGMAYGTFDNGANTSLGMDNGLILSSGNVLDAQGPNNSGFTSTVLGAPGDADLDALSLLGGDDFESFDGCIVELSVFANTPKLTFEYTFGSEEYPEFADPVSTQFNDIFAFLISGPGITGVPELNNQENLAIIPTTGEAVEIQTINYFNNWQYYRDNFNGSSIQYDAMTTDFLGAKKTLTAQRTVVPCNTYKIKLAIADRSDASYDSGVFIGEITTGLPTTQLINADGLDYFVEGCSNSGSVLNIILSEPFPDTTYLSLIPSGEAQNGVDYNMPIPSPLFVVPGQTVLSLPIDIVNDALDEGTESMNFALQIDYGCGAVTIDSVASSITDVPLVEIQAGDSLTICGNECVELTVEGASVYDWQPSALFTPDSTSQTLFCPEQSGWIVVLGSIGNIPACIDYDSIYVTVPPTPEVNIVANGDLELCTGESVTLTAQNNNGDQGIIWTSDVGIIADSAAIDQVVVPTENTTYIAQLSIENCIDRDTVVVAFDNYYYPDILVSDTSICQGDFLVMSSTVPNSDAVYSWTPADLLSLPNQANTSFNTDTSGTFVVTLSAASINNFCGDTISATVTIDQISLDIVQDSPEGICLGDIIELEALYEPANATFTWSSSSNIPNPTNGLIKVNPTEDDYFVASVSVPGCSLTDSILVRVSELPIFDLTIFPDKEVYCEDDQIILQSSPNIDEGQYQGIEYTWATPAPGIQSSPNSENLTVVVTQDFTYQRITDYNGCRDTSTIDVDMLELAPLQVLGDFEICVGESTQLTVNQGGQTPDEYNWTPDDDLSCDNCPDPIATPSSTTNYTLGTLTQGCFQNTQFTVTVVPEAEVEFPDDLFICPGEAILLNALTQSDYTYSWTASPLDPSLIAGASQPIVTPNSMTTYTLNMSSPTCPPLDTSITIQIIDQVDLMIDPSNLDICEDESVTLYGLSNVDGTYVWSPGNEEADSIVVSPNDTTTYTLQFDYGCGVLTEMATINVVPIYPAFIECEPDLAEFEEGQQINLSVDSVFNIASYSWSNGGTEAATSIQALNLEGESITLTITYGNDCIYETTKDITVIPAVITMPNAFTPDNDGINDFFRPTTEADLEISSFKVWNRWGNLVYDNLDPLQGWDGMHNDKAAASDVYLFEVIFFRPNGEEQSFSGNVTLIR